ncbi:MAG: HNH endonuclease [Clostridia bacterium]|nr:HNH endonuclease [Clostridia bacterium]
MQTYYLKTKTGIFDTFPFKKIKRAKFDGKSSRDMLVSVWFEILELSLKGKEIGTIKSNISYISRKLQREEIEITYCLDFYLNNLMIKKHKNMFVISSFGIDKNNIYVLCQEEGRTSKEYRTWRLSVLERDNFKCQICGNKENIMHAHHIIRWKDNVEKRFDLSNGVCLCESCHRKLHKGETKCQNE